MEDSGNDKRKFPRIDIQRSVKYRAPGDKELRSGRIENISSGGVCIYTREALKKGDMLSVEFKLPGNIGHVVAMAKVMWVKSASESPYESSHWAGINFEKIPERSQEEIIDFVTRKIRSVTSQKKADGKEKEELPSVLIVDDDEDVLEMMKAVLGQDFNVIATRNGSAALELAQTEKPDLIFLDIQMPILDGLHTLVMLKDNNETKPIPVFMLSVSSKKSDVITAFKSGAAGFISKPFEPETLIEKAKKAINQE